MQEAKVEARLGDLVQSPLAFLKILLGLSLSLLTAFDEPLEAFAAERLVVLDGGSAQLSHDVLLRDWPRLRGARLFTGWRRSQRRHVFRYAASDLLVINTSDIDFVERSADLQQLLRRLQDPVKGTQYFLPLGAAE